METQKLIPTAQEKNWAIGIHLSIFLGFIIPGIGLFAPIVLWLLKRHESDYLDFHGKEATNLSLTSTILLALLVGALAFIAYVVPTLMGSNPGVDNTNILLLGALGINVLVFVLMLSWIIYSIIAAVKTSQGVNYHHTFAYPFFKTARERTAEPMTVTS